MPASYDTHYLCRRESSKSHRHWIRKENAILKGKKKIPYCPDCGRKLSVQPLQRKFKKKKAPWEINLDSRETPSLYRRVEKKCPHCNIFVKYMKKMERLGRYGVYQCPECKCIFCLTTVLHKQIFVLVRKDVKCPTLKHKE